MGGMHTMKEHVARRKRRERQDFITFGSSFKKLLEQATLSNCESANLHAT
jgi:hypothetical protein